MKGANYISQFFVSHGITDAFGVPGGVILDLIYALHQTEGITPHLSYHEQAAGFEACGYAQASGKPGIAYATRGPGFTNMLTPMADAYHDSIPVIFITGHTIMELSSKVRVVADQEMDTCAMVKNITKYARRIDSINELQVTLEEAYHNATSGRKGPVFLDINASLYSQNMTIKKEAIPYGRTQTLDISTITDIVNCIKKASRPILLIGDGINQEQLGNELNMIVEKANIPVLSSRYAHNVIKKADRYYGFIGSRGFRYSNFILTKADLIISCGNRLGFPSKSVSFCKTIGNTKIFQIDIDKSELKKHKGVYKRKWVDLKELIPAWATLNVDYGNHNSWIAICNKIREVLWDKDKYDAVDKIMTILDCIPDDYIITGDVGNNELWLSRACVIAKKNNHTLYSKSLGALGNSICKAIGAYYATRMPSIAFIGDQGMQFNIQELQTISQDTLPIKIIIVHNSSSGMIKDREESTKQKYLLHTTTHSGYGNPDYSLIAKAHGIDFYNFDNLTISNIKAIVTDNKKPALIQLNIDENDGFPLSIPKGFPMQDMYPFLERKTYNNINNL